MTLAGILGQGKLLVLYPAFRGEPAALPVAHGIQRTLARRLKACGLPTMFGLMRTRVDHVQWDGEGPAPMRVGDIDLAVAEDWPDDVIADMLVRQFACRWGVVIDMTATDSTTRLLTRVFEANDSERGSAALRERWSRSPSCRHASPRTPARASAQLSMTSSSSSRLSFIALARRRSASSRSRGRANAMHVRESDLVVDLLNLGSAAAAH